MILPLMIFDYNSVQFGTHTKYIGDQIWKTSNSDFCLKWDFNVVTFTYLFTLDCGKCQLRRFFTKRTSWLCVLLVHFRTLETKTKPKQTQNHYFHQAKTTFCFSFVFIFRSLRLIEVRVCLFLFSNKLICLEGNNFLITVLDYDYFKQRKHRYWVRSFLPRKESDLIRTRHMFSKMKINWN